MQLAQFDLTEQGHGSHSGERRAVELSHRGADVGSVVEHRRADPSRRDRAAGMPGQTGSP